jgi:predicted AAA+ superfamily ATPase
MTENITSIAKYNFWNGNAPDLGYERKEYLEKMHRFTGNKLVKVLVGQRRTGKSYQTKDNIRNNIICKYLQLYYNILYIYKIYGRK